MSVSCASDWYLQDNLSIFCEIALRWMPQGLTNDKSTKDQVIGLVPPGNKPLPEPMLTNFSDAMWQH